MSISNKGILKPIVFVIVFLLAVVIGGIVFWQYPEMQDENIKNNEGTVKTEKDIETSVLGENKEEATDWKIYRNEEYKLIMDRRNKIFSFFNMSLDPFEQFPLSHLSLLEKELFNKWEILCDQYFYNQNQLVSKEEEIILSRLKNLGYV